jgi:hypothetical protein
MNVKDEILRPHAWKDNLDLLNIVMIGVTNDIPEQDDNYELHRLIGTLVSNKLGEQEKLDIIEREYNIPINNEFREEVTTMCNLSDGIEERAVEKNTEQFIMNMHENDFSLEQISLATKKSIEEIERIIEKNEPVLV